MGLLVLLSALWLKMSAYEIHVFLFDAKFLMSDVKVCSYVDKTFRCSSCFLCHRNF